MKYFNFVVTFGLMVLSTTAMATDVKKHSLHNATAHSLHAASAGEDALTFLSKSVISSDGHYLHGSNNSILDNQLSISDTRSLPGSFRDNLEHKSRKFHKEFDSDYHKNIAHVAHLEHFNNSKDDEFENVFHDRGSHFDSLGSSLNAHFCEHHIPAPVPEPETYAMMGFCLLVLSAFKRRKQ